MADDALEDASPASAVQLLCNILFSSLAAAAPQCKLPILYALDYLSKKKGPLFQAGFSTQLVRAFMGAFETVSRGGGYGCVCWARCSPAWRSVPLAHTRAAFSDCSVLLRSHVVHASLQRLRCVCCFIGALVRTSRICPRPCLALSRVLAPPHPHTCCALPSLACPRPPLHCAHFSARPLRSAAQARNTTAAAAHPPTCLPSHAPQRPPHPFPAGTASEPGEAAVDAEHVARARPLWRSHS